MRQHRFRHADGLNCFRHVVRADDLHAASDRQTRARERGWQAFVHFRDQQFSDERFARDAEQQRPSQLCKTPQAREQLQILFQSLPKPMPGSKQPVRAKSRRLLDFLAAPKKICRLRGRRRVDRILLHRLPVGPVRVHADVAGAKFRDDLPHCPLSRSAATSLTMLAPAASAARATAGFIVSIESGILILRRQFFDYGNDAAQFLGFSNRRGAGRVDSPPMSRISAPCATSSSACATAASGVKKFPAVGKGIGRDVDDAHDERRTRKNKFKLSGAENHLLNLRYAIYDAVVLRPRKSYIVNRKFLQTFVLK